MSEKYIEPGDVVRHYKNGKCYVVISSNVTHTETGQELVIYQDYSVESKTWARPKAMFEEKIEGVPRFQHVRTLKNVKLNLASRNELVKEVQQLRSEQLETEKALYDIKRKLSEIDWLMHQY